MVPCTVRVVSVLVTRGQKKHPQQRQPLLNQVISAVAGAQQVNSDWTQTNASLKSFIQNKPTAGANISFANNQISLTDFVGIGTTPHATYKLDVNGTINATELRIANSVVSSSKWTTSGVDIYNNNTGNVGIGTITPTTGYKLDVRGSILSNGNFATTGTGFVFAGGNSSSISRTLAAFSFYGLDDIIFRGYNKLHLVSGLHSDTIPPALTITTENNVGIGTTGNTTGYKLSVAGSIISSGSMTTDSVFGFSGVANSEIARVKIANGYSTSSVVNDMVIRSTRDLRLQSGITDPAILIQNTTNNVLIGSITNSSTDNNTSFAFPDSTLFVRGPKTAGSTTNITFRGGLEGNNGGKVKIWLANDASHSSYIQSEHTTGGNTQLTFGTSSGNALPTEKMKISNDGRIDIQNRLVMTGTDPTIYLKDTDQRSGMIHMNSSIMYFLRGSGNGSETWQQLSPGWPLELNMDTNEAKFGGKITALGGITASVGLGMTGYVSASGYILTADRIYARGGGNDATLNSVTSGCYLDMGNQSTEGAPTYCRIGAYLNNTWIESNNYRDIRFRCHGGVLDFGAAFEWNFNNIGYTYNARNTTTWTQYSDQRLKENIVKADLKKCYDNVKNINLYRFNYINAFKKNTQDKNILGYIAQEVKRHFPKAVSRGKERLFDNREVPDLLNVDVEQINLSLYGAVKQLIKIVEKQNKRIKTLETLLNIEDDDNIENDAGEVYEKIIDDEEINIDDIEPTEPPTDELPQQPLTEPLNETTEPSTEV